MLYLRQLPYFALLLLLLCSPSRAQESASRAAVNESSAPNAEPTPQRVRQLSDQAAKSVVVIKYVWEGEADRRELEGLGLVVNESGLIMAPLDLVPALLPDNQLVEFQILVPQPDSDPRELSATLLGRDERSNVVFVQADAPAAGETAVEWTPVTWGEEQPQVGEWVVSVGRLPEGAGYAPYVYVNRIAAHLRGPTPLATVGGGGLTGTGSVVLDAEGRTIGLVQRTGQRSPFLTGANPLQLLEDRPTIFVPTSFYDLSLSNPPKACEPLRLPFLGVERMTGLTKELRQYYELGERPAIQVGDVIEDSPAATAGVKNGDVIIALNDQPLERGDAPEELPEILNRTIIRMPLDAEVKLTLLDAAKKQREVTARLTERPQQVRQAKRWFAQDLGFSVRELVFADRYMRKLPKETPGVAVAYVREQSNAAAAGVRNGDLIRKLNQNDVQGLEDFQTAYEAFREESPEQAVVLEVLRGAETQVLRIEPPR